MLEEKFYVTFINPNEMSRIGKNPVSIPQGVDVNVDGNVVTVKGKVRRVNSRVKSEITVN